MIKNNVFEEMEIPKFLDLSIPANVKARELAREVYKAARMHAIRNAARKPVVQTKPAKSVVTAPRADKPVSKPAVKAAAPAKKSGKHGTDAVIRVLVDTFGHKAGSKAEAKSAALVDGMTVAEYTANDLGFAGKWHASHISHCVGKGFIKLEG